MRAFMDRYKCALVIMAVFSVGAVLLSPSMGLCITPSPPTYYLTVEKSVDQSSVTLALGATDLVTFTVKVFINSEPPETECYLTLDEGESVVITDTQTVGELGHIYYDSLPVSPWVFSYPIPVGPYVECGDFMIENVVTMAYNPQPYPPCTDTVTVNVHVPCEQPGTGTPGYWMNHPEAWPASVSTITVGCEEYTKDEAIAYMKDPVKGDKSFTMFPALVAAKLNVLIGNDASCVAVTIAEADAWLCAYPLGSGVKGEPWEYGEPLYWELDDYNNGYLCAPSRDLFD